MRRRMLTLAACMTFFAGLSVGQVAQSNGDNPGASAGQAATPDDAKKVSVPPVPADKQQEFQQSVKDIHFDFDQSDIRDQDQTILAGDAEWLKAHPDVSITLEGDADERGTIIYNLVLSGARAEATKNALVQLGVPENRIVFATGWGKLYPVCTQADESCWSQNRRTHFSTWPLPESTPQAVAKNAPGSVHGDSITAVANVTGSR